MNPVSCGIAMRGWLSRMSRSSVVPEPIAPTMKIGPCTGAAGGVLGSGTGAPPADGAPHRRSAGHAAHGALLERRRDRRRGGRLRRLALDELALGGQPDEH